MIVLGIESSCDETAAAIVDGQKNVLSHTVLSQEEHIKYGGVIPEVAARAHLEYIDEIILQTLKKAGIEAKDLDAVAVSGGPGLIGGVVVGVMAAKAMALALNKPLVVVNHLEAHALCARLSSDVSYPFLLLLVSGGHCQILIVKNVGEYVRLGTTLDDAAGEAFDKVAKMLGLGYPGGPMIEKYAQNGNPKRFVLPRPLIGSGDCNLSFSGLKTAVRKIIETYSADGDVEHADIDQTTVADICASFQLAVTECLVKKLEDAIRTFKKDFPEGKDLVVSGGVAANSYLRASLEDLAKKHSMVFSAPPIKLCTDNGVMVAWAGLEKFEKGMVSDFGFKPRPRWPLDENAPKVAGAGGVKA